MTALNKLHAPSVDSVSAKGSIYSGPIIDIHFHPMLGSEPVMGSSSHTPGDYMHEIEGLDVRKTGALVMASRANIQLTREQNDFVLELGTKSKGRFYPVCSVHPLDGQEALDEIDRVVSRGAKCLKLHPNTQDFDVSDPGVEETVRRAAEKGVPVLFDAYSPFDADQPGKFVRLAMSVPDARLILAHAHGPRFPDLLVYDILSRYPWWRRNVWIDVSATGPLMSGSPFAEQFLWVMRKVGVDRLLFGSDYPLDKPKEAVHAIASLGFRPDELRRIFYQNASGLFGF